MVVVVTNLLHDTFIMLETCTSGAPTLTAPLTRRPDNASVIGDVRGGQVIDDCTTTRSS